MAPYRLFHDLYRLAIRSALPSRHPHPHRFDTELPPRYFPSSARAWGELRLTIAKEFFGECHSPSRGVATGEASEARRNTQLCRSVTPRSTVRTVDCETSISSR